METQPKPGTKGGPEILHPVLRHGVGAPDVPPGVRDGARGLLRALPPVDSGRACLPGVPGGKRPRVPLLRLQALRGTGGEPVEVGRGTGQPGYVKGRIAFICQRISAGESKKC